MEHSEVNILQNKTEAYDPNIIIHDESFANLFLIIYNFDLNQISDDNRYFNTFRISHTSDIINFSQFQSLKKEVDWGGGGDDKSCGESLSDYKHLQESVSFKFYFSVSI